MILFAALGKKAPYSHPYTKNRDLTPASESGTMAIRESMLLA
jgi:hypothetical protein